MDMQQITATTTTTTENISTHQSEANSGAEARRKHARTDTCNGYKYTAVNTMQPTCSSMLQQQLRYLHFDGEKAKGDAHRRPFHFTPSVHPPSIQYPVRTRSHFALRYKGLHLIYSYPFVVVVFITTFLLLLSPPSQCVACVGKRVATQFPFQLFPTSAAPAATTPLCSYMK